MGFLPMRHYCDEWKPTMPDDKIAARAELICTAECQAGELPTLWILRVPIGHHGFAIYRSNDSGEHHASVVSPNGFNPVVTCGRLVQVMMAQDGFDPPTIALW